MRAKVALLAGAGLVVVVLAFTLVVHGAHAQPPAADDCWSAPAGSDIGNACEHLFKDGSKCIMFSRAGVTGSSAMACKITQVALPVPAAPSLTVG